MGNRFKVKCDHPEDEHCLVCHCAELEKRNKQLESAIESIPKISSGYLEQSFQISELEEKLKDAQDGVAENWFLLARSTDRNKELEEKLAVAEKALEHYSVTRSGWVKGDVAKEALSQIRDVQKVETE